MNDDKKVYEVVEQSLVGTDLVETVVDRFYSKVMAYQTAIELNLRGNPRITHFVRLSN